MGTAAYIVTGMWGTSNLTLSLLNAETGLMVTEKVGPGIAMLDGRSPEDALFGLIEAWRHQYNIVSIQLSGMVGSNIGWIEVPYLECPLDIRSVAESTFEIAAQDLPVSIVPGLSCLNSFGHPDVMRGEETELLSWAANATTTQLKNSVLCIPGTHAKWVQVKDGQIASFFTSVVGEVYQVISANGVLAKPHYQKSVQSSTAFLQAIKDIADKPQNLLHLLFTTRANTVIGKFTSADATDYLSGLLIGADLNAAIDCFGLETMRSNVVPLIGAKYLTERYKQGLAHWGVNVKTLDAAEIGAKGLYSVYCANRKMQSLEMVQ